MLCIALEDRPDTPCQPPPASGAHGTTAIKVLHVINGEHYAGAERVQDLLAGQLGSLGYRVGLACVKPGRFPKLRQAADAPLYELPMRGRFDLRPAGRLVRIIRREGYQLLHAHTPRTLLLATLASLVAGVPVVYHVHSPASRDSTRPLQNFVNAVIERFCMMFASAWIAVSQSLGRQAARLTGSGHKVFVVHNGVPCREATDRQGASAACRWTLGTVALFRPRKGTEVLLEALARLKAAGVAVKLRAVGGFESDDYQREILALADALGVAHLVEWVGFTRDVDAELERMDLFVLPSLFGEGLPMVVLEAMAAGVPVVATRVEGVPEAIRHGVDGLIAEPADAQSLAEAIGRIVAGAIDPEALRRQARERQREQFSDRSMARGVARVYRQVLSRRARKAG